MSDTNDLILQTFSGTEARSATVGNIDQSPDDAARAIELADATGTPAPVIAGDLPTFEKNHKAQLASGIVSNNSYISDYVFKNSMASRVSNDDYGNLDAVSQTVQRGWKKGSTFFSPDPSVTHSVIDAGIKKFKEGFGDQAFGSWVLGQGMDPANPLHRAGLAAWATLGTAPEFVLRVLGGGIESAKAVASTTVEEFAKQFGADPADAVRMGREAGGMVQMFTDQPMHMRMAPAPEAIMKAREALISAKPWIDKGVEPPMGVHPIIDQIKIAQSEADLKLLEQAQKEAQSSTTKERAPALFQDFVRSHTDAKIGISPDAIRKLYGDKPPVVDDNILGFIPDLANKLRIAEASGQDIQVPLADWLTKVDLQIAKELGDDVRVRRGGVTKNEGKEATEAKAEEVSKPQFAGESLPDAGLVPANMSKDGTIYVGKKGGQHFSISEEHSEAVRTQAGLQSGDSTWAKEGFVTPRGEFLDRQQALAWVEKNEKKVRPSENMGDELDALDYRDQVSEARKWRPDQNLDSIRTLAGIKTLYDTGERKLELKRFGNKDPYRFGTGDMAFHDFKLVDESGRDAGILNLSEQKGGKLLYVEDISGIGGFGPKDFGPSLMRQVLRQIKEAFPNAEELTGFRVSGAREKAGSWESHGKTRIKLDTANLGEIVKFFDGVWEQVGTVDAKFKPKELYTQYEKQLSETVNAEVARIAGKSVDVQEANQLKVPGAGRPSGVYQQFGKERPLILWAMTAQDPMMTGRHEAMHHLRQYGFFTEGEWNIFASAAQREGWMKKYNIHARYSALDIVGKEEEAVVHAFAEWRRDPNKQVDPQVRSAFEKLKDLFDSILAKIKEIIGREPTWEELFEAADRGDIGSRRNNEPLNPWAYKESREPELPGLTRMEDREVFAKASAVGMTVEEYKLNMKLIEQLHTEDLAKAEKRAEVEVKRRQTDTWKANEVEVRKEAVENINARPDIVADTYFRDGMFYGKPTEVSKLNEASLTPEQLAALPKQYVSKSGIAPDELAGFFGYHTGSAMVDGRIRFEEAHKASGKRPAEFKRLLVNVETQRLMEQRYGKLAENILDEAKEQALSETQMNLTHQDTLRVATKAGLEFAIDGEAFRRQIREDFREKNVTEVSSDAALSSAGRAMQLSRRAALKEDWQETFRQQQRHYISLIEAAEARLLEMEKANFAKTAKRYSVREPKGTQEYTNYIQQLLQDAGAPVKLLPDEIARSIEFAGTGTLDNFVASKAAMGWEPDVAPTLREGRVKQLDQMTVGEFEEFKAAIDSLNDISRKEQLIEIAGEKLDYVEWKKGVIDNITELPARPRDKQDRWFNKFDASIMRMEEMVKDLDLRQELGPLFNAVIVPMMRSKSREFDLVTDLAKHFKDTRGDFGKDWRKSLKDEIPQTFLKDPYDGNVLDLTRENLVQIMLNWGNRSNIEKTSAGFAQAYLGRRPKREEIGQFEQAIKALIDQHATKQDWDFVSRMWQPFKTWQPMADTVARNVSGSVPKWIQPEAIDTPHGVIEGGYWPVKYDRLSSGIEVTKDQPQNDRGTFGPSYFRAATAKGYLKERTGYIDYVDVRQSLEQAAGTMQQMIHDIAFRDALVQAGKVFYDKEIRAAIRKHYGVEYEAQLIPWLRRIANVNNVPEKEIAFWNDWQRRLRINLVGHALPLNLKVILSPDVGVPNPVKWASFEANRSENVKLAMEKSQEIRHMVYNMDRDYREALQNIISRDAAGDIQSKAVEWGFKPMMKVSQEFRMATFVDRYHRALGDGRSEAEAASIADSYVREQHGAASVVDLPALMQSNETLKSLTMFYGYFNTMYNWQRQLPGQAKRGEWDKFAVTMLSAVGVGAAFNALLFNKPKKDEGWFSYIARAIIAQPLSTVPIVREAATLAFEDLPQRTPTEGLMSAVRSAYSDAKKATQGKRVEKPITHAANVVGVTTGLPLAQIGRTSQGLYDVSAGYQRPKTFPEWWRLVIHGEANPKR